MFLVKVSSFTEFVPPPPPHRAGIKPPWLAASFAARAEVTYTITSYPAGLADLPCDAFKKNPDGSWTQVAILVAGGALIVGLHFKNTNETRIIESKCDRK